MNQARGCCSRCPSSVPGDWARTPRIQKETVASQPQTGQWLLDAGLKQLELLFRAVVYQRADPILIADNNRNCWDASCGVGKLLGLPRDKIIGRRIDDFAEPGFRPQIDQLWRAVLQQGEQRGLLRLAGSGGSVREVEYAAKGNVLPACHLLALHDQSRKLPEAVRAGEDAWVHDYALFLLDADGQVAAWYSGAERIYEYQAKEIAGQRISCLYPAEESPGVKLRDELKRAAAQGHFGNERWQIKKDGLRFWANVLTMALRNESGELQGFARVVRDLSKRHSAEEKLQRSGVQRLRSGERAKESTIAGVVSGEFDNITEANDAFLGMIGYSREDCITGQLYWPDLTPAEYWHLDEKAYEECMRYGACTPFEKEYVRKDGTRVSVLVAVAALSLSPFHWITIAHILPDGDGPEKVDKEAGGDKFPEIIGRSAAQKRVLEQVETVAPTDATVLILGETGTGKELIARAIHRMGRRNDRPFISLNCAAIPTGLLESELFGYERGAFTGALGQKIGRFELAHHGTLFLDEVGDIPLELQPKLLRALQEKSFERLGGTRTIPIDVRLVAATNRNLAQMMSDKLFRADLYYRLRVFPITMPRLRDRPEDIPALAEYFTWKYAREMNKHIDEIPPETMRALVSWPWPGNVRELENFIERSVILSRGPTLRAPLAELRADPVETTGGTLEQMEREYVVRVLRETRGVISAAATRLGLPRTSLNAMMGKLGIS
ncbi:MAG: sigma 54-interacting transcriptional regulator, partial [Acidobacteriia bacterium]|nr:sigma 54-interacting transcriptional regulator [Terriglobia bacterium]